MRIGAHVSVAGGVANAVDRELAVGGNCGQIFTHSPQVWRHTEIEAAEASAFVAESAEHLEGPWVIHSSYLVNLATPDPELRAKSIDSLQREIDAAARLDVEYVNVHLGAHTGAGVESGLENATTAIDELDIPPGVTVLVESDAGSGTKLGGDFDHLAAVRSRTDQDVGFCLDTAHTFAAGYDLSTPEAVDQTVGAFDDLVGLDNLACIHLNDSKHECGSHKDEHAHIGEGKIGIDGMRALLNHESLWDRPFILETPTEDGKSFEWNINRSRGLRED